MKEKNDMKQKTAMQELFEKFGHLLPNVQEEYLEKEKQQIMNDFNNGVNDECLGKNTTPEQYYSETYNQNNNG